MQRLSLLIVLMFIGGSICWAMTCYATQSIPQASNPFSGLTPPTPIQTPALTPTLTPTPTPTPQTQNPSSTVSSTTELEYIANAEFPLYLIKVKPLVVDPSENPGIALFIGAFNCLRFCPTMKFQDPPERVECLAAYARAGKIYLAQWDIDGRIYFEELNDKNKLTSYGTYEFSDTSLWKSKAFENKILDKAMVIRPGVTLYFAIAACGGDMSDIQGARFEFIEMP